MQEEGEETDDDHCGEDVLDDLAVQAQEFFVAAQGQADEGAEGDAGDDAEDAGVEVCKDRFSSGRISFGCDPRDGR